MRNRFLVAPLAAAALALVLGIPASAQQDHEMDHDMSGGMEEHMRMMMDRMGGMGQMGSAQVAEVGQAAFATISEVVASLRADPETDWTRVDIEALRRHLIDMDEVTLHAQVGAREIPGGVELTVTGDGRTVDSIRRMTHAHAAQFADEPFGFAVEDVERGVRVRATVRDAGDEPTVAMVRGLGFAGLMTIGAHHTEHHLAIARGGVPAGHEMDSGAHGAASGGHQH